MKSSYHLKEAAYGHPDSDADNVHFTIPYDLVGNVLLPLDETAPVFPKGYRRKSQTASAAVPGCTGDRLDTDAALCIRLCRRDRLRGMGRCAKGLHLWPVFRPLSCHAFRNEGI